MSVALPFVVFALFAGVIWVQQRRGVGPARVRYADLPKAARATLIPAWLLGLVGIVGASGDEALEVVLIPAGALLVVGGVALRSFRSIPGRANPRVVGAGAVVIGIAWAAIGLFELVTLLM